MADPLPDQSFPLLARRVGVEDCRVVVRQLTNAV
jgi:hypothetical protein